MFLCRTYGRRKKRKVEVNNAERTSSPLDGQFSELEETQMLSSSLVPKVEAIVFMSATLKTTFL